ncbi:AAA family ATPase [Nocardiopsis valliformis]|uniref:AAA family ATPase n=1 Tax=Nocardiopsis valliformis TaxID=239974 RepID=UPI000585846B|nr:AAA family ATPase [Nocardiopsis valliformis]
MAVRVLVTGMSGNGKSSALVALGELGHRVVETDGAGWWEPRFDGTEYDRFWREDRIAALLAEENERTLFVSGTVPNQGRFYDRFDAVVLLSAPEEVVLERVAARTEHDFGKRPGEREKIRRDLAEVEPLLRAGATHEIDTRRPLTKVVDELVAIAQEFRTQ